MLGDGRERLGSVRTSMVLVLTLGSDNEVGSGGGESVS
jgi:hypothetical protein